MSSDLKRLMLYHHFDRDNQLDAHVVYQLRKYHDFGIEVVFLSNSPISDDARESISGIVKEIIVRDNSGFDFGAWREYLRKNGRALLEQYDRLLLSNSSCYGPLFPLEDLFGEMEQRKCDFWGLTSLQKHHPYPTHVQSYFVSFKPKVFLSDAFMNYWNEDHEYKEFNDAIWQGEIGLSRALIDAKFRWDTYADLEGSPCLPDIDLVESYSFTVPDFLIACRRLPLVKIKAFLSNSGKPHGRSGEIIRAIRDAKSDYPLKLIYDHMRRTQPLSWQKNLPETLLMLQPDSAVLPDPEIKLGVIGHFFYPELFEDALEPLRNIPYSFDLLVSTCSEKNAALLRQKIAAAGLKCNRVEVRVVPNLGRDIGPWLLSFRDLHDQYDLILKIHSKKSITAPEIVGNKWTKHITDSLLASPGYVSRIINAFVEDPKLGTVMPPYPPIIHLMAPFGYKMKDTDIFDAYLKRCCLVMPPKETNQPVFSTGTIFWYRPSALRSLFDSGIKLEEFPKEPMKSMETSAHALERIIPYVVQSNGYYYRQAASPDQISGMFRIYEDRLMAEYWDERDAKIERLEEQIDCLCNRTIWKLTWPLRKTIDLFKAPYYWYVRRKNGQRR